MTLRRQGLWVTLRSRSQNLAIWVSQRMLGQLWFYANLDLAVVVVFKQEDARRCFRGMCGFKKELQVCWMKMEVEWCKQQMCAGEMKMFC